MKELFNYFFSPFKRPKLRFYLGKTKIGVPYFLPRRAIRDKSNPGRLKFVTKNFGFDTCRLGWKTKWRDTDFRFEWGPVFSFVFFGYQLAITIEAPEEDHYWESWLYYHKITDKSETTQQRIDQCVGKFPQNWIQGHCENAKKIDYYQLILKEKWRPKTSSEIRDNKIDLIFNK